MVPRRMRAWSVVHDCDFVHTYIINKSTYTIMNIARSVLNGFTIGLYFSHGRGSGPQHFY
jgi:hypothetical protein